MKIWMRTISAKPKVCVDVPTPIAEILIKQEYATLAPAKTVAVSSFHRETLRAWKIVRQKGVHYRVQRWGT